MALQYPPSPGEILLCDYARGFQPPEMVKRRPVIVLVGRLSHRNNLATVVPCSTSQPDNIHNWHARIEASKYNFPRPFNNPIFWVKSDMLCTVSLGRLDMFKAQHTPGQKRKYLKFKLQESDFDQVRKAVLAGLNLL